MHSFYMCSYRFGNFTYLFSCDRRNLECCGYACCEKTKPSILYTWYFWSLTVFIILTLFCIIWSCILSGIKTQNNVILKNLKLLSHRTNLNQLSSTIINKQGLIQPKVYYNNSSSQSPVPGLMKKKDTKVEDSSKNSNKLKELEVPTNNLMAYQLKPLAPPYKNAWNNKQFTSSLGKKVASSVVGGTYNNLIGRSRESLSSSLSENYRLDYDDIVPGLYIESDIDNNP